MCGAIIEPSEYRYSEQDRNFDKSKFGKTPEGLPIVGKEKIKPQAALSAPNHSNK
ncbi:hypothetical protein GCM10025855_12900 [Shewanella glacialipiscicola]|uniref:Uncharacterized protein n=1 Tax=Shewanella glacialipiscicola TaxID=614069 RepID=A0ABQ6J1Y5_9GAMM|nr:hypothetical protein GCM10025855_12900 [Shewanella glacialipiscicola]